MAHKELQVELQLIVETYFKLSNTRFHKPIGKPVAQDVKYQ